MILRQLCQLFEKIAPPNLSADWDNNGLLVGDPEADVTSVLLAIDFTRDVLAEAIAQAAELVLCYHPPIFKPLRNVVADELSPAGRVFAAIRSRIALYAMHTTLDAAAGGTNDALAEVLGLRDARPLAPQQGDGARYKLVTFVPQEAVERVANAIFAAGGGQIGDYSRCSFRIAGTGTFLGGDTTHPAVGQAGNFEKVDEVRLEVELPAARAAHVVAALRQSHPYETAAFDLIPLVDLDERVGLGRIGSVASPAPLAEMVERIKRGLGVEAVWLAAPADDAPVVSTAACCAGSCGELYRRALAGGAQLYLTGEFRHHDAIEAARAGMAVVAVRHSVSERLVLARLAKRIADTAPGLTLRVSESDADPFRWA
ncbi:MAG: Nif3-like dinuclear metal center hexameric protein [Phycisphaerae bacterium]|nr:Nif3-like dinuclear metal center hexameric protein [Phycisphaerae bacterium]